MAAALGMNLIVVDEREEFASRERFPGAVKVMHAKLSDPALRDLVTQSTYVVIFTHSHELDKEALGNFVESDAAYIGMIGSGKKVTVIMRDLKVEGIPAEKLNGVYSPIGLDIGAETPAEIAVSILSEIIHVKRKGSPSPVSMKMVPPAGVKKKRNK
jgi:xanthine dehydrogenase accessory factor